MSDIFTLRTALCAETGMMNLRQHRQFLPNAAMILTLFPGLLTVLARQSALSAVYDILMLTMHRKVQLKPVWVVVRQKKTVLMMPKSST